jgi:two-component system chemotaxis response regulator CheY
MPDIKDLKVLVVDDHMLMRKQMDKMLRDMGFTAVDQAPNASEAAAKLTAGSYNIVFLDWHMPGQGGISLMQQFREDRRFDATAFVVVSAESENRFIGEALKAGATAYVVKPATEPVLKEKVGKVLVWLDQHMGAKAPGDAAGKNPAGS